MFEQAGKKKIKRISYLKKRQIKIPQSEEQKQRELRKMNPKRMKPTEVNKTYQHVHSGSPREKVKK